MIVDIHCHPTNVVDRAWRHGGTPFTGERLIKLLDGPFRVCGKDRRIDYAFVQPPPGNTVWTNGMRGGRDGVSDYMAYMRELVKKYPDRLIGCFTYNPRFGVEEGVAEFERHVKEFGFKMLKLHANMHAYRPDRATDLIFPVVEKAAKFKVPVLLHTGDGPYSIPSQFYPLVDRFPDAKIIIGHFGIQTGAAYCFDAAWMTKKNDNVLVESGWCFQSRIVEFAELLGPEKIVFGTDSPPNEPGVWIRMLEVLTWDYPQGMNLKEEDLEKMLGDNIAKLTGLSSKKW
jgi:predicted TIM-barrel fold metal-dependent hydrolase